MTGIVLALAGLTCADGGPGMGTAVAPVRAGFAGAWEGTWDVRYATFPVRMKDGVFRAEGDGILARINGPREPVTADAVEMSLREGRATHTGRGIYKLERGQLLICVTFQPGAPRPTTYSVGKSQNVLIRLRPRAAPRQP